MQTGVIGVGAMGMGVAKRLLACGYEAHVRDIRPEAEEEARAAGATVCASPAEVGAACPVVVVVAFMQHRRSRHASPADAFFRGRPTRG